MAGVMPDLITHTHTTPLGPTLVGWQAWQRLGMPELLGQLGFNRAQEQAAATSVSNRLIDPGSELALVDWLPDSSLPELMAMEIGPAAKDRFYRGSDRFFEHRQAIEEHLRQAQEQLFETDRSLLLYHYLVNDSRRGRASYRAELLKEDEFAVVGHDKLDVKWDRLPETKLEVETEAIL